MWYRKPIREVRFSYLTFINTNLVVFDTFHIGKKTILIDNKKTSIYSSKLFIQAEITSAMPTVGYVSKNGIVNLQLFSGK